VILIESSLILLAVLVAFVFPNIGGLCLAPLERGFVQLARRRGLSVVVVGLTALAVRVALLPVEPIPRPGVHDEFAYLLAADTFAHGRLSNPTHPMWAHFETFYVNQKPTYGSMFYPAQGLFLAAGQVIFGHPFWGVWLSAGLMCAAICWMLQAWLPPSWALLGGLLAVVRLGSFSYWANSYWGGAVPAIGGALVLGALPRIKWHQRVRDSLLMGLGLAILANSRPYESLFFCLPVAASLLVFMLGKEKPQRPLQNIVVPIALVLVFTIAAMGYYFWRTTGSPINTPYLINTKIYNPVPYFPWQALKPVPEYHHAIMRNFYLGWGMAHFTSGTSSPVLLALSKAYTFWLFLLGPIFTVPLLMLFIVLPYGISFKNISPKTRLLLLVCGSTTIGLLLPMYFNPHYPAPMTCAIYALLLQAMRHLMSWQRHGRLIGLAMIRTIVTTCVILVPIRALTGALHPPIPGPFPITWCSRAIELQDRAALQSQLSARDGQHLIIVRYQPDHSEFQEWVYNEADIDNAKVVWARDMGPYSNEELISYFKARRVWLMDVDEKPPRLVPYALRSEAKPSLPATGAQ
jgi:hypothetical protein